jgi:alanyl-tRNA synthetase
VYEVDTVAPLYHALGDRVIADHLRAACAIIGDGVGVEQDRATCCAACSGAAGCSQSRDLPAWFEPYDDTGVIGDELARFENTLAQGLKVIGKLPALDGKIAFDLFQTYGFPVELTIEIAAQNGTPVDRESIRSALEAHRQRSKNTRSGAFSGGLADHSEQIVRYHTLTHLLQASLRRVLGEHVIQRGSNITPERLRFDYSHDTKPSPEQLASVERTVNDWLARDLVVERRTMSEPEARSLGAIGAVRREVRRRRSVSRSSTRTLDVVSREFCGGPHVDRSRRSCKVASRSCASSRCRERRAPHQGGAQKHVNCGVRSVGP